LSWFLGFLGVPPMRLTERRKQFLHGLMDIYRRTQLPVHYEALAQRLGVSKWTAYDMLRSLEKQGLLARDYTVHRGEPGRSQIVFVPTPAAEALVEQVRSSALSDAHLAKMKEEVLGSFRQWRELTPAEATQRVLEAAAAADAQVKFCAYVMTLFLVRLSALQKRTVTTVREVVCQTPGAEMQLTMFMGIVAGMLMEEIRYGVGKQLIRLLGRFLKALAELPGAEKRMLVDFLDEALAEAALAH